MCAPPPPRIFNTTHSFNSSFAARLQHRQIANEAHHKYTIKLAIVIFKIQKGVCLILSFSRLFRKTEKNPRERKGGRENKKNASEINKHEWEQKQKKKRKRKKEQFYRHREPYKTIPIPTDNFNEILTRFWFLVDAMRLYYASSVLYSAISGKKNVGSLFMYGLDDGASGCVCVR